MDVCRVLTLLLLLSKNKAPTTLMVDKLSADDPKFVPLHDFIDISTPVFRKQIFLVIDLCNTLGSTCLMFQFYR